MNSLNYKYMINKLTNKHDNTLKFLMFINILLPTTMIIYYIITFVHILGLLIISNSFLIDPLSADAKLTEALRKLTSFYLFGNISQNTYETSSIIIFLIVSIYILLLMRLYINIKYIENYIVEEKNSLLLKLIRNNISIALMIHQRIFNIFNICKISIR
jgi:hypothetical protein